MGPIGLRNDLSDVAGLRVGHAADGGSGVTVILPDRPAVTAADIRGGGPGTRETDALDPGNVVEAIHGVVLAGGSAFGLAAADGVVQWLAERAVGVEVAGHRVPVVPSAVLFDLDRPAATAPDYRALGRAAAEAAADGPVTASVALGSVGAGTGARAGMLKGGLGSAAQLVCLAEGSAMVAALAVANPLGSVTWPDSPVFWAWPWERAGEFGGRRPDGQSLADLAVDFSRLEAGRRGATTLVVVATDADLTRPQARRLAIMAQDGIARAIRPVHTPFDGDSVFALATARRPAPAGPIDLARLGSAAADCTARAIARGVYEAVSDGPLPAWRDLYDGG